MKSVVTLLVFSSVISIIGCAKSSPIACATYALEISDEVTAYSEAASAYSADPSSANCKAYKDAGTKYLKALRSYDTCTFTAQDRASYNASLKEAQAELDNLTC